MLTVLCETQVLSRTAMLGTEGAVISVYLWMKVSSAPVPTIGGSLTTRRRAHPVSRLCVHSSALFELTKSMRFELGDYIGHQMSQWVKTCSLSQKLHKFTVDTRFFQRNSRTARTWSGASGTVSWLDGCGASPECRTITWRQKRYGLNCDISANSNMQWVLNSQFSTHCSY